MMTYTYKLYRTKRTAKLDAMLREACFVWNHALEAYGFRKDMTESEIVAELFKMYQKLIVADAS